MKKKDVDETDSFCCIRSSDIDLHLRLHAYRPTDGYVFEAPIVIAAVWIYWSEALVVGL